MRRFDEHDRKKLETTLRYLRGLGSGELIFCGITTAGALANSLEAALGLRP